MSCGYRPLVDPATVLGRVWGASSILVPIRSRSAVSMKLVRLRFSLTAQSRTACRRSGSIRTVMGIFICDAPVCVERYMEQRMPFAIRTTRPNKARRPSGFRTVSMQGRFPPLDIVGRRRGRWPRLLRWSGQSRRLNILSGIYGMSQNPSTDVARPRYHRFPAKIIAQSVLLYFRSACV
jgi:hypothetical protein